MEMLKLLIADTGEGFRQALSDQLRGTYRIRICREGRETLEMLLDYKPDLVVLDMMLPGLDGISILQEAARCGLHPTVLATTKYPSDFLVESAAKLQVAYMMVKPCDVKITAQRIRDLTEHIRQPMAARPEPRTIVSNTLLSLGISTKLRGYAYLREAILQMMENPGQSVTKELYPEIGKICDATPIQVERSIRSAIGKAWKNRDEAMWQMYFRNAPVEKMERPSNAVFISCIADRMGMDRDK